MSSLIRCIYSSAATVEFGPRELKSLLNNARTNNEQRDITGMLLYVDGSFFQVIEGEAATIASLYDTINKDGRHTKITKLMEEPIQEREFDAWTMGFLSMSRAELNTVVGTNDFLRSDMPLASMGEGRARQLLTAFRDGKWRTRLAGALPRARAA